MRESANFPSGTQLRPRESHLFGPLPWSIHVSPYSGTVTCSESTEEGEVVAVLCLVPEGTYDAQFQYVFFGVNDGKGVPRLGTLEDSGVFRGRIR